MRAGLAEGRALGLQKGFEIGELVCTQSHMHAYVNIAPHLWICMGWAYQVHIALLPPVPGVEVGHYAGCVRMWRALQQQQPGSIPAKLERSIAAMEECLLQYPLYNPQVSNLASPNLRQPQEPCLY